MNISQRKCIHFVLNLKKYAPDLLSLNQAHIKRLIDFGIATTVCSFLLGMQPAQHNLAHSSVPRVVPVHSTAEQQLTQIATEIDLPIQMMNPSYQSQIVQSLLKKTALELGIPVHVALALGGYESRGWQMWSDIRYGDVLVNTNRTRQGDIHSHDWGVMQINDQAHPQAFPKAAEDIKFNIQYGLAYLASLHATHKGNMNLGFGQWDKTLAAYHLGHRVKADEYRYAQSYVKRIRNFAIQNSLIHEIPYTIQKGDTLSKIAYQHWGQAKKWKKIQMANPDLKLDEKTLQLGQVIQLPLKLMS